MTVKAEIAKNIGGNNCPINHRSINGITFQGKVIPLIAFIKNECLKSFKTNYSIRFNNFYS